MLVHKQITNCTNLINHKYHKRKTFRNFMFGWYLENFTNNHLCFYMVTYNQLSFPCLPMNTSVIWHSPSATLTRCQKQNFLHILLRKDKNPLRFNLVGWNLGCLLILVKYTRIQWSFLAKALGLIWTRLYLWDSSAFYEIICWNSSTGRVTSVHSTWYKNVRIMYMIICDCEKKNHSGYL